MSLTRYALIVVAIVGGSLALAWPLLARGAEPLAPWAALLGGAVAAANTLGAYSLVLWSRGRPTKAFLGAVLGGMVGRMALMLGAVVAAVLVLGLPRLPLVTSLLAYFALFLALELSIVQRNTSATAGPS